MGFGQAVKHVFTNYVNFRGRASRPEFWWFFLFLVKNICDFIDIMNIGFYINCFFRFKFCTTISTSSATLCSARACTYPTSSTTATRTVIAIAC